LPLRVPPTTIAAFLSETSMTFPATRITDLFDLSGQAALVTGASSGIGLHLARTLAEAGASVTLAARRMDRLHDAVEALRSAGFRAHAVALDITRSDAPATAWRDAEAALGQPIDILINNAGVISIGKFVEQDAADVDRIFRTNVQGAFAMAQVAARAMAARGAGSIINVASTAGLRAAGQLASYGASKAALIHLTKIAALELASKGVRINAIAPGNFETDMHAAFDEAGFESAIRQRIPMRRFGQPADLDGAALLLASRAGNYITGITLPVDGGQLLSWM
jgi:NAD(P)-dependent dehydrogenase (short-subunit alcohol dehydrogenase family)